MNFFAQVQSALDALRALLGEDVDAADVSGAVQGLSDDDVVALVTAASALVRGGESLRIAGSGVVSARSTRGHGHRGLAQTRGHRSPVSLIQDLTGTSRADATRQVRLGESLAAGLAGGSGLPDVEASTDASASPSINGTDSGLLDGAETSDARREASRPWHAVLGDALMAGTLTVAQHDAILRGLGHPPLVLDGAGQAAPDQTEEAAAYAAAWAAAAAQLVAEAGERTVEELAQSARTIRDLLDPAGAEKRFDDRFQARAFRIWTDADGQRRGAFTFDDEAAVWVTQILHTALRPRRGGPRFVDPAEKQRADDLTADPRSNDQLAYDLVLDLLRTGALADPETVFGTRQAGVRLVMTRTAADAVDNHQSATGLHEDDGTALPAWVLAQHACHTGTTTAIIDETGNPLDMGREARLFTPRQRIALAIRDGGCRWTGCDRPASYCEAHHIDEWHRDGGRTDIDRGLLLCRFHHMNLHHHGWRITRDGRDDFHLHPPDGGSGSSSGGDGIGGGGGDAPPPIVLTPRLARRYAWGDLQPPPRRTRPAA